MKVWRGQDRGRVLQTPEGVTFTGTCIINVSAKQIVYMVQALVAMKADSQEQEDEVAAAEIEAMVRVLEGRCDPVLLELTRLRDVMGKGSAQAIPVEAAIIDRLKELKK